MPTAKRCCKLYSVTACQDGSQTGSVGYRPNKRHFLALAGEDTSVQGRLRLPLSPNTSSLANRAQVVIEVVKAFASSEDTSCTVSTTNTPAATSVIVTSACCFWPRGGSNLYCVKFSAVHIVVKVNSCSGVEASPPAGITSCTPVVTKLKPLSSCSGLDLWLERTRATTF